MGARHRQHGAMRCAPGQQPMCVDARQLTLASADSRLRQSASAHPGELRPPGPPACAALAPLHPAQHSLHFPVPARQDSLPKLRTCIGQVEIIGVINHLSQIYLARIATVKVGGCFRHALFLSLGVRAQAVAIILSHKQLQGCMPP